MTAKVDLMIVNITFDQSVGAAPDSFKSAVDRIARIFSVVFTDTVTINVAVGWGEVSGLTLLPGALGEAWVARTDAYAYRDVVDALAGEEERSSTDIAVLASLPAADPMKGGSFSLPKATAKAIGLLPDDHTYDGYVAFNSTPGTFTFDPHARALPGLYDFFAVAAHEFSHVMGRTLGLGAPDYTLMDLFRYSSPGDRALTEQGPAYFSLDGGKTSLGVFSSQSLESTADWATRAGADTFSAAFIPNHTYDLGAVDIMVMDALGWTAIRPDSFLRDDGYIVLADGHLSTTVTGGALLDEGSSTLSDALLVQGTAHGWVHLESDGGLSYTPAAGFSGIDQFTYHALVNGTQQVVSLASVHVIPTLTGSPDTIDFLVLSAEHQIGAAYTAYFGRAPDVAGFAFWLDQYQRFTPTRGGHDVLTGIASSFGVSQEATKLYPFLAHADRAEDAEIGVFLARVYDNLFNRLPDADGLNYWVGQTRATLAAGQFVGSILVDILSGTRNTPEGLDATTLMGKVIVGLHYEHEQRLQGIHWARDIDSTAQLLTGVTSDPHSVLMGVRNADALLAAHGSA